MQLRALKALFGTGMIALVVGLVGCAAESEAPPPGASTQIPAATTGPSVTPSATPAPTTEPAPGFELAACDRVLTQKGYDDLAADNLVLKDATTQRWDYRLVADVQADGILCTWAGGGDVFVQLGQLPMDELTWNSTLTTLEAEGYVQVDTDIAGYLDGPDDNEPNYTQRGFAWRDGILYYASYPGILEFVPAFTA